MRKLALVLVAVAACKGSKQEAGSDKGTGEPAGTKPPTTAPTGACPTTGATTLATSDHIKPIGIAVTGNAVYWASDKGIEMVPSGEMGSAKGEAKTIVSTEGDPPVAIAADGATVHWLTMSGKWNHVPAGGGPVKTELTGDLGLMPRLIIGEGGGFYATRGSDVVELQGGLLAGQGGSLNELTKGPEKGQSLGIVADRDHIFWLVNTNKDGKIVLLSTGLHGGDTKTLATFDGVSGTLTLGRNEVVVAVTRAMGGGSVYTVDVHGGDPKEIASKQDQMVAIASTGSFEYTTPYHNDKTTLRKIERDAASTPVDMFCTEGKVFGLGMVPGTGGTVFFSVQPDGKPGTIMKIKK